MSLPPLVFFSLTPEEDEDSYIEDYDQEDICTWIDDSECQENLFDIITLTPEETRIDKNNQIYTTFKLFFEELGYLTEEPEPIDPTRDYEAEARELLNKKECKNKRRHHIELPSTPSLDDSINSDRSSYYSSSIYQNHYTDIRSPHYMGNYHQCQSDMMKENLSYHYRSSRSKIY